MIFYGVNLLRCAVKFYGLGALVVSDVAGFFVLVLMLNGALLGVFLKDFTLFLRVTRAMQQECIFRTGRHITLMTCIVSLALAISALIRVGW